MVERKLRTVDMDTLVSLSKRRGIVFQSSEIYGGVGSVWDYGPAGVELKRNIKDAWWRAMVRERDDIVGLDAAILMNPEVWVASGHVSGFTDPLGECRNCNFRFRSDELWAAVFGAVYEGNLQLVKRQGIVSVVAGSHAEAAEAALAKARETGVPGVSASSFVDNYGSLHRFDQAGDTDGTYLGPSRAQIPCPSCGHDRSLTNPRQFNLMFKTFIGPVEDESARVYLRPETAQGIFVNFSNVQTTTRRKLPFGIAQIGKSFRNEITPGNFIFRTREFEQMEMEYFCKPGTDEEWHRYWTEFSVSFFKRFGIRGDKLRVRVHEQHELPHYSKGSADVEYEFPWGWGELETVSNRTDYDLKAHIARSGKDLSFYDDETRERYVPFVVEPAMGADRSALAFLADAYDEEPGGKGTSFQAEVGGPHEVIGKVPGIEKRVVLRFHPDIAPVTVAVLPLSRNDKLVPTAKKVHDILRPLFNTQYDDAQSIGRRYRRQDEIGTPLCVTVDFETVEKDGAVTIRNRDLMSQVRVPVARLPEAVREQLDVMRMDCQG